MKNKKLVVASMLVGISALALGTATACDGLPTWLGGKEPTYKVVININGIDTEIEVGKGVIPQKPADPVKEGYDFKGWYLDEACTKAYNFDTPLDADSTLYAYFSEKEYVVTFVVDGEEKEVSFTWSQTPSIAKPRKNGYVFKGWCLDEDCTVDYVFTEPVREALTVYAKFAEAYKVNYVVSPDGTQVDSVETEKGTMPIKPENPMVEGFDFKGWYLDEEFTTECNFDTVFEEDTTVYAKFIEKEYEVTYLLGGTEKELGYANYKWSEIPVQPEDPKNGGEFFFGWFLDEEYTQSYDFSYSLKVDTIVYAKFLEYKPVYTIEDLLEMKNFPTANYELMNDIDYMWETWEPITEFSGKFNGNGYKIHKFMMNVTSANGGFISNNKGTIENLTLERFVYSSNCGSATKVGTLAGINNGTIIGCTINNPYMDNQTKISYLNSRDSTGSARNGGGLVGENTASGVIKNTSVIVDVEWTENWLATDNNGGNSISVSSTSNFGGVAGVNAGTIENVYAKVKLVASYSVAGAPNTTIWSSDADYGTMHNYIGGVAGNNTATIYQCETVVDISASYTRGDRGSLYVYVGGAVAVSAGASAGITESISSGSIVLGGSMNSFECGGIAGRNMNKALLSDSHTSVAMTTTSAHGYVGGLVGGNTDSATVQRSYAMGSVTSSTSGYVGGFVGYMGASAVVKNCFCVATISAGSAAGLGAFVGAISSSSLANCYYSTDSTITKNGVAYTTPTVLSVNAMEKEQLYSENMLVEELYWNYGETLWRFDGVNPPALLWEPIVEIPEEEVTPDEEIIPDEETEEIPSENN